jgi:hypothetical protein
VLPVFPLQTWQDIVTSFNNKGVPVTFMSWKHIVLQVFPLQIWEDIVTSLKQSIVTGNIHVIVT